MSNDDHHQALAEALSAVPHAGFPPPPDEVVREAQARFQPALAFVLVRAHPGGEFIVTGVDAFRDRVDAILLVRRAGRTSLSLPLTIEGDRMWIHEATIRKASGEPSGGWHAADQARLVGALDAWLSAALSGRDEGT